MKRDQLQKCALCRKGLLACGIPLFFRLRIKRFGVNLANIQRHHGMELMMGGGKAGAALARVLGTDEDIATPLGEGSEILICNDCASGKTSVDQLAELEPIPT